MPRRWKACLVAAAAATAVVAPLFFLGLPSGHDFEFHAASWLEVSSQWKQGVLYPRWAEWANWGFGEPRFIFYPPISWILGAALGLVLPWMAVPGALIWLSVFVSGVTMHAFARRWLPERAALPAAVFYAVNPYALLVVYVRSDFAEHIGSAVYPLALLAAFEMIFGLPAGRQAEEVRRRAVCPLLLCAGVYAAMWLANAPAGMLASYSLALAFLTGAILRRSLRPVLYGAASLGLGLLLAGFYVVPVAYEQRWVHITDALVSGLRPEQSFLYTTIADPEHNRFNSIVSTVAVGVIVLAGLAAAAAYRARNASDKRARDVWWLLVVLAAVSTFLMLPVSSVFWAWLPELKFLQFPWRWLVVLAVPLACFLGVSVSASRYRAAWAAAILLLFAGSGWMLGRRAWWDTEDIPNLEEAVAQGHGYEGTDEYDPLEDDRTKLPQETPRVAFLPAAGQGALLERGAATVHIEAWKAEEKIVVVRARPDGIGTGEPLRVALRLVDYPAWRVEVNGRQTRPETPGRTAQMVIRVEKGESRIRVVFARTFDRTLGLLLSLGGLLASVGLAWLGRERRAGAVGPSVRL